MAILWKADPNLKTGGYFYDDTTGQPLPPSMDAQGKPIQQLGTDNQPVTWDGTKYVTATQQAANTKASGLSAADALVAQWEAQHGKRISEPSIANPTITNPDSSPGAAKTIPNPNPTKHYTFADNTSLDIDSNGNVVKQEAAPTGLSTTATNTAASQGVNVTGQGVWGPDPKNPGGPWIQKVPQGGTNPDEDITKAITRQTNEAQRNEREANAAAGKGYMTNQEAAAIDQRGVQLNQSQQQIDLDKQKFGEQQRQFDATQKTADAKAAQDIVESTARTGQIGATTNQIQSATDIAAQKAGPEINQIIAATGASGAAAESSRATTARTQQTIAQGNAPTVENIAGTSPVIYQRDPNTGALTPQMNTGFMPKTTADVAARVSQLQAAAQAQRDQLLTKQQAGQITPEQANTQFNQWWSQTVEPQKAMLDAAQQTAVAAEQRLQDEQQRSNLATAQTGAGAILTATEANRPNSPAYAAALGSVLGATRGAPKGVDFAAALSAPGLDAQDVYTKATAAMLQHISPTAAQISTGSPTPTALAAAQNTNIGQALNQTNYGLGGAPPPMAAGAAAPPAAAPTPTPTPTPAPVAPPAAAMSPDAYAALQQRILADQQEQARQAQVQYIPPNYQPAFA